MEARRAGQETRIRTTETVIRRAGDGSRTGGYGRHNAQYQEASQLIRQNLSPTQQRRWDQMPESKKKLYVDAVMKEISEENTRKSRRLSDLGSPAWQPDVYYNEPVESSSPTLGYRQYHNDTGDSFAGVSVDGQNSPVTANQRAYERTRKKSATVQENISLPDESGNPTSKVNLQRPGRSSQRRSVRKAIVTGAGIGTGTAVAERVSKATSVGDGDHNIENVGQKRQTRKHKRKSAEKNIRPGNMAIRRASSVTLPITVTNTIRQVRQDLQAEERQENRRNVILAEAFRAGSKTSFRQNAVFFPLKKTAEKRTFFTFAKRAASFAGSIFKPFLIMLGVLLLCIVLLVAIIFPGSLHDNSVSMEGLPAMISEEMVTAAIEMRDEYNQPASVLLAQIIVESRGRYGNGLSLLAYQYHNLFGIKSFSSSDNRIFMWNRAHTDGGYYRIFENYTECIEYRAQMLTRSRYARYTTGIDWTTTEGAKAWAQAVKNGGWAEDPNYVSSLVEQMNQYNLYRYDAMSETEALTAGAGVVDGGTGAAVVEYACQFIGNRYVWGGESLTNGCDCSGFVMKVYEHFGVSMPHSSYTQRSVGRAVSVEDMQPGDIVCYSGHVGIYVGNGQIVNASNSAPYPRGGIKYTNAGYRTIVAVRRIF